jgi:hypothetical protein
MSDAAKRLSVSVYVTDHAEHVIPPDVIASAGQIRHTRNGAMDRRYKSARKLAEWAESKDRESRRMTNGR